jgi:competence protein ComEC
MPRFIPGFLFVLSIIIHSFGFTAYVIDVKQGSSSFIKLTEQSGVLIDAGNSQAADHIIQYLKDHGIDTIKMAILSHPDPDHMGGMEKIIQSGDFVIRKVVKNRDDSPAKAYKKMMAAIKRKRIPVLVVKKDTVINNVDIRNGGLTGGDLNYRSLAVYYMDIGKAIAFMGDADVKAEKTLMHKMADVIVVSEHGAATATGKEFLTSVKPDIALISVGKNSRGYPSAAVLGRLKKAGVSVYRTDKAGDIEVSLVNWVFYVNGSPATGKQ